ncbi:short-chain dehydrogenase [Virgibacillus byunsanensis]|uniref:Short-chain dehydrogenase n=1 Tax=Virgibacillus byunsanensis TaxID=570945 RepID=A0ABW3LIE4_9BACI
MQQKQIALVIGGTGMLRNVCHWLVENGYIVFIIGRSIQRHKSLKENSPNPENIHALPVDYHDLNQLQTELNKTFHTYGSPQLVVSWIHSSSPVALPLIINELSTKNTSIPWRLFHIQGSARFLKKENTPVQLNCLYRRVYLGFMIENNISRWLTHEEISNGIIQAIKNDNNETIIGTLEPWDMRP